MLLFYSMGSVIPVRYLFGSLMAFQILLGPMLAYNGLDQFQPENYQMRVSEATYFSYVIPAVICFILGLHIWGGKLKGEIPDKKRISEFVNGNKYFSYILIVVGFIASVLSDYTSSDFTFVFYLLGSFKYIGVFLLILGNQTLKIGPLILVYGSIIASSLGEGMFHDLMTWLIFLGAFFSYKYKPNNIIKFSSITLFIVLAIVIQVLKGDYREATWKQGEEAGISTIAKTYEQREASNTLFDYRTLAKSNIRINQGYIITNIMSNIPAKIPFAEGDELKEILEAALLPRFLAPDKLTAGNRDFFMKYSGMKISKGTSMGLSSVGDGYINFGVIGGCIFMFLLGIIYSEVLKIFEKYSRDFPIVLVFVPLVFYYPIRPDCEFQTILGHLVKSCFLIFVVFLVWKKYFKAPVINLEKDPHPDSLVPSRL